MSVFTPPTDDGAAIAIVGTVSAKAALEERKMIPAEAIEAASVCLVNFMNNYIRAWIA